MSTTFAVGRSDLRRTEWIEQPRVAVVAGQVRMRIDSFALTSNNITYGAFGSAMHYWDFFPLADPALGCIPVWGFATVTESRASGVAEGDRFYGYFPMADDVVLEPASVRADGFTDGALHRRELAKVYNRYLRCDADPLYDAAHEGLLALLRPLFTTSFLIEDFLHENGCFGARRVLISSASSKTAYGLAFCLAGRRAAGGGGGPTAVGLTSPGNVAFTRRLGCYDEVVRYDDIASLASGETAVYVDMSGDVGVREAVHRHWLDRLGYSCAVGATHWEHGGGGTGLPGPRPVLFFAPSQSVKR